VEGGSGLAERIAAVRALHVARIRVSG
jgi:hypothetical protein